jgi:hypothetical protein
MFGAIASRYQWQWQDDGDGFWILYDPQNRIQFGVELNEGDVWTWTCNAVVLDLDGKTRLPDPLHLLRLNDGKGDEGLVWCFYSIGSHDLGQSLYVKYGAITPLGDLTFASKVIATVLRNMQKFTVRTRSLVR